MRKLLIHLLGGVTKKELKKILDDYGDCVNLLRYIGHLNEELLFENKELKERLNLEQGTEEI